MRRAVSRVARAVAALRRRLWQGWEPDWPTSIAGAAMVLALAALQAWDPALVESWRLRVFDQYVRLSPRPILPARPVVIVDIDDQSLQTIGQWPWSRATLGRLIDTLGRNGALVIGADLILAEPDRLSPPRFADEIAGFEEGLARRLRELPDTDLLMAEAVARHRVVLAQSGSARELDQGSPPRSFLTVARIGGDPSRFLTRFPDSVRSMPVLEAAARGSGLVTVTPELDGIVRRIPLVAEVGGRIVPTLALEMLRVATDQTTLVIRSSEQAIQSVVLQGVEIPTDRHGQVFIHFSRRNPDLYLSAADVLGGKAGPERLQGRFVLIGTSAAGLGDIKATPIDGNMPGVEVHAQLLETIFTDDHLTRPAAAVGAERVFLLVLGLVLSFVGPSLPAAMLPPALLLAIGVSMGTSWIAFSRYGILLDGSYGAVAIAMLILWLALAKYVREQTQRRRVRNAFSYYLSEVMVDRLSRNPKLVKLGGERRVLTVLFSDIRGFTSLSERYTHDPEGLTRLLNRYLTEMTAAILAHGGTIDKYIGDAIMAFWNAPLEQDGHPEAACLAALEMRRRLGALNSELGASHAARGLPFEPIELGTGINTGPCFVGNLGSEQRFNYSVLGDTVNVAARLEGQTKAYTLPIIIGESTDAQVAGRFATLPLDTIRLKGKSESILVHALLGGAELAGRASFKELEQAHAELLAAMTAGDLDNADRSLRCCVHHPESGRMKGYYLVCRERIEAARRQPAAGPLDGMSVARTK
ncbi:MAG TPA: adenylate/guanylate cyclase domain-containing protein [Geminicoccaceae bacterium]|nr:adenylate/guanylate cyclase domain-containing protein [Geminicoccaceae bacterium]